MTEGLQVSELWGQFKRDAQVGFQFYRRDYESGAAAEQRKGEGFLRRVQEIVWAILSKLSPARRVLLLIGTVLLLFPSGGFPIPEGHDRHRNYQSELSILGRSAAFHPADAGDRRPRGHEARS